jgi:hypothetical protein
VFENIRRWLKPLLKIGFPAIVILQPIVAVYGFLKPWEPARATLATYVGQTPVLVGFCECYHSSGNYSSYGPNHYVLFPSVFMNPKIISIKQVNGAPFVEESPRGFVLVVAWYLACIVGTWWFWPRSNERNRT